MKSCIYEGEVFHRRETPIEHRFSFPLFMMYLDLEELPTLFRGHTMWGVDCFRPASFHRRDHLGEASTPLDQSVRTLIERRTGKLPTGPIRLLTHLRYGGFGFNPVSFYYAFEEDRERIGAVVAEVHNTPWSERFCYVLDGAHLARPTERLEVATKKSFHVSPFMGMQQTYNWKVETPGERLSLRIASHEDDKQIFEAALSMKRRAINRESLTRALYQYPLMTTRIVAGIYWQALRLWSRGAKFHPHPRHGEDSMELTS